VRGADNPLILIREQSNIRWHAGDHKLDRLLLGYLPGFHQAWIGLVLNLLIFVQHYLALLIVKQMQPINGVGHIENDISEWFW